MLEGQHNFFFGYAGGQEFFRHPFFNPLDLHPNLAIMEANLVHDGVNKATVVQ